MTYRLLTPIALTLAALTTCCSGKAPEVPRIDPGSTALVLVEFQREWTIPAGS